MIETILGANAGNQPHPDFEFLGVELKTLPVSPQGIVTETTFVCSIDLKHGFENTWHDSRVFNKLKRVLWFPVEDDNNKDWTALRLGQPFLWSPSPEQERILSDDWHDHIESHRGRLVRWYLSPAGSSFTNKAQSGEQPGTTRGA